MAVNLSALAGAMLGSGFFLGREHAKAEYRVIEQYYGKRSKMPWYGGFERRAWNKKSMLDWIAPTIVAMAIATYTVYN